MTRYVLSALLSIALATVLAGCPGGGAPASSSDSGAVSVPDAGGAQVPPDAGALAPDAEALPATGDAAVFEGSKRIGPEGGTLTYGPLQLQVPAGALSATVEFSVRPAQGAPSGNLGAALEVLPNGTTFARKATLRMAYAPADLGASPAQQLELATVQAGAWAGATAAVDVGRRLVIGEVDRVGVQSLLLDPAGYPLAADGYSVFTGAVRDCNDVPFEGWGVSLDGTTAAGEKGQADLAATGADGRFRVVGRGFATYELGLVGAVAAEWTSQTSANVVDFKSKRCTGTGCTCP